jgi:hypothetical protein
LAYVDLDSTSCYLLAAEDHRDGESWAIHRWDLAAKGLQPDPTVADGGKGWRAGQALAWPRVPCRGDVFPALQDLGQGGDGTLLAENDREKQRKLNKYNHLVANCLIFHNVYSLTRILYQAALEGKTFDERR